MYTCNLSALNRASREDLWRAPAVPEHQPRRWIHSPAGHDSLHKFPSLLFRSAHPGAAFPQHGGVHVRLHNGCEVDDPGRCEVESSNLALTRPSHRRFLEEEAWKVCALGL